MSLSVLNEEQIKPAMDTNGAILVTAGAGSGKTRLLTERISYLINECGVSPSNILAITFTNKATNEMKERLAKVCENADQIWISTFHSMCAKILRENISNLEGFNRFFTIYDTSDKSITLDIPDQKTVIIYLSWFEWYRRYVFIAAFFILFNLFFNDCYGFLFYLSYY